MQTCMQKYPTLYSKDLADDDDMAEAMEASDKQSIKAPQTTEQIPDAKSSSSSKS